MKVLASLFVAVVMSASVASAGEFDSIVPGKTAIVFNAEKKISRPPMQMNHVKIVASRENGKKCELAYSLFKASTLGFICGVCLNTCLYSL